ncbi:hypothetical protein [Rhodococcus globerulus]|uniref:Uncharacterized protein n=1 Tax=Rhodococcus globerulus TaxID=33008 RepID=A0ABU4BS36_RHOGO|nr:hypothetical protein [Rhodococcus globerulus]MDV6267037.1 hypothetical protein [Rhodococcus globerulus]
MSNRNQSNRSKRKAERELFDGKLIHPSAAHGTANGYNYYGCQCEPCVAAAAEVNRQRHLVRAPRRIDPIHMQLDEWARSIPNRTPIPAADLRLAALIREGVAA